MDGLQSTIHVDGPVARSQLHVFYVTCWVTLAIFVLVGGVLAYATFKFRARSDADANAEPPPQGHGNPLVELGLIGASVLALVVIAVPTLKAIWYTHDVPGVDSPAKLAEMVKAGDAYEVNAIGYQWWFKFEYPTEQAEVDANTKNVLVTGNELVIPAGKPVRVNIRTVDVIHSFWVPKLAGKVDMIPNRANFLWLQADKAGYYFGQCAEYCGDSHAVMRFRVIALDEPEYKEWLNKQNAPARTVTATNVATAPVANQFAAARKPTDFKRNEYGFPANLTDEASFFADWRALQNPTPGEDTAMIAKGRELFTAKTCVQCHTVRGHGAVGMSGPDLTHFGSRSSLAGGLLHNSPEQLQRWLHAPGEVKQGNKMAKAYKDNNITLTDEDERALVAYLLSLK